MASGEHLQLGRYRDLAHTELWKQLANSNDLEQKNLAIKVQKAAGQAKHLLDQIPDRPRRFRR